MEFVTLYLLLPYITNIRMYVNLNANENNAYRELIRYNFLSKKENISERKKRIKCETKENLIIVKTRKHNFQWLNIGFLTSSVITVG